MHDDDALTWKLLCEIYQITVKLNVPVVIMYDHQLTSPLKPGIYRFPQLTEAQQTDYEKVINEQLAKYEPYIHESGEPDERCRRIRYIDKALAMDSNMFDMLGLKIINAGARRALRRERLFLLYKDAQEKNYKPCLHGEMYYICIIKDFFIDSFKLKLDYLKALVSRQENIIEVNMDPTFPQYFHESSLTAYDPGFNPHYNSHHIKVSTPRLFRSIATPSSNVNDELSRELNLTEIDAIYTALCELKTSSRIPSEREWKQIKQRVIDSLFITSLLPIDRESLGNIIKQLALLQCIRRKPSLRWGVFHARLTHSFTVACDLIKNTYGLMNEQQELQPIIRRCIFNVLQFSAYKNWDNIIAHVVNQLNIDLDIFPQTQSSCIEDSDFDQEDIFVSSAHPSSLF